MSNGNAKSRYGFGQAQNWLDDEAPAPPVTPENDREAFLRKTREAATSVGYVAPSEQPGAQFPVTEAAPKPRKAEPRAKVKPPAPAAGRGRRPGDRTYQMSVRIRQEHDDLIKSIAQEDFSVASIVEAAIVAFAKELVRDRKYKRLPLDEQQLALAKSVAQHAR